MGESKGVSNGGVGEADMSVGGEKGFAPKMEQDYGHVEGRGAVEENRGIAEGMGGTEKEEDFIPDDPMMADTHYSQYNDFETDDSDECEEEEEVGVVFVT